jgi:hypothetical protein
MSNLNKGYFFGILLALSANVHAQTRPYSIGVEGGTGSISLRGNSIVNLHGPGIAFSGGFTYQYFLGKVLSLRSGLSFERKGSLWTGQATDVNGNPLGVITSRTNWDYLTLPVLLRTSFGKKKHFFINAGPYVGHLVQQGTVTSGDQIATRRERNNARIKQVDFGLSTGLGLNLPLSKKLMFSVEVRNNRGLYNISSVPVIGDGSVKTNATVLLLGVRTTWDHGMVLFHRKPKAQ